MIAALLLAAAAAAAPAPRVELLRQAGGVVWGFDFLPDGRIIFSERGGRLFVLDPKSGKASEIAGAPRVWASGQGGLLDVRHHAGGWVYLSWSQPVDDGAATALGRGRLQGGKLTDFQTLFVSNGAGARGEHFGGRLELDGEHVYLTHGDRGQRERAQRLDAHNGKVLRFTLDGKPAGAGIAGALPEIWSWGHRNPQGIAKRPGTEQLWSAEFGPRGGDELNLIRKGANYGWPVITYGREYWGPKIGPTHKEGMEQPVAQWTPVISPSGMAFAGKNSVYLACLSGRHIRKVSLTGDEAGAQESLLEDRGWRFRQVRAGPDGDLYFSTDDGRIGRLALER